MGNCAPKRAFPGAPRFVDVQPHFISTELCILIDHILIDQYSIAPIAEGFRNQRVQRCCIFVVNVGHSCHFVLKKLTSIVTRAE